MNDKHHLFHASNSFRDHIYFLSVSFHFGNEIELIYEKNHIFLEKNNLNEHNLE